MKNKGEAHLFLQELLEWYLELHCVFFERHLHFISMQHLLQWQLQIPAYFQTLSLRLTQEIVNLSAHHVPRWSCCQHCEHTAAQVGLTSCPTDKAQKSWHRRRLLGHFWGLDVLNQGQAPWPQHFSQYQWLEVLNWREKNHFLCLLFLTRFCTFSINIDSILPYTEVASDFQSETLTVFIVTSTTSTSEVVVISFNSHDTTSTSRHIFTCHNTLRLFKKSHNMQFCVVAVSLIPHHVVVFFPLNERFQSLSLTCTQQISILVKKNCEGWSPAVAVQK